MKRILIITGLALVGMLFLPVLIILAIVAVFSQRFRAKALFNIMLARVNFETRNQPIAQPEPYGLVIDKLSELKVSTFIKVSVTGELSHLVIDGAATPERLAQAWSDIQSEYYEKAGGENAKRYIDLRKKIVKLNLRINHVQALCDQFEIIYDTVFIDALKGYGYNQPFTQDSYLKDIKRVRTGEKRFISIYEKLLREFDREFNPKADKKQTEQDYYNTIEELRKHGNYQDDPYTLADKWNMETYCLLLTRFNDYVRKQNEQIFNNNAKKK